MTKPVRLQLSRKKGFRLQTHSRGVNGLEAVSVARPGIFGNPCLCQRPCGCPYDASFEPIRKDGTISTMRCCVDVFRHYVETGLCGEPTQTGRFSFALEVMAGAPRRTELIRRLPELRGKNLACWCKPEKRCHADILLELCNR